MEYLAWFVLIFTGLQLVVALVNLLFASVWTEDNEDDFPELVSVLIPARNEEENIAALLDDLKKQSYRKIEIIVFDDQSTDNTAAIVQEKGDSDRRIKLIRSSALPQGWLGKNFACHNLSKAAVGKYFLFLDADVRLDQHVIGTAVKRLKTSSSSLLSVFPQQLMHSVGEKAVVPLMNYILLTLLVLPLVRYSTFRAISAANGQFMLFDAIVYKKILPHKLFKAEKVEDIKIARMLKRRKYKISCLIAKNGIRCRMYRSYAETIQGFSKNMVMFFGNSYIAAFLFWLITTFGFVPFICVGSVTGLVIFIGMVLLTRVLVSMAGGQSVKDNLLLFIPQQINMMVILVRSVRSTLSGELEWKGRKIV